MKSREVCKSETEIKQELLWLKEPVVEDKIFQQYGVRNEEVYIVEWSCRVYYVLYGYATRIM